MRFNGIDSEDLSKYWDRKSLGEYMYRLFSSIQTAEAVMYMLNNKCYDLKKCLDYGFGRVHELTGHISAIKLMYILKHGRFYNRH